MLVLHTVQKLLNTSRIGEAPLLVASPSPKQLLQHWYVRLLPTGFAGKMLVLYIHQPSLATIVCTGKTVQTSWNIFLYRLPLWLERNGFPADFIDYECSCSDDFVITKTSNRTMLAHLNRIGEFLQKAIIGFPQYESIDLQLLEEKVAGQKFPYQLQQDYRIYTTPVRYLKEVHEEFLTSQAR